MAVTPSTMLELGTPLPPFSLSDTEGRTLCADDFWEARALLVVFLAPHCPYVRHLRAALAELAREYQPRGLGVVGINANDPARSPSDGVEGMRREKQDAGYPFPYLMDASQEVARSFHAACTPDFFLFGPDRLLLYRGRFDDSRPGSDRPVTGRDLRTAVEAVLAGRPVAEPQHPSMGCGIKWRAG